MSRLGSLLSAFRASRRFGRIGFGAGVRMNAAGRNGRVLRGQLLKLRFQRFDPFTQLGILPLQRLQFANQPTNKLSPLRRQLTIDVFRNFPTFGCHAPSIGTQLDTFGPSEKTFSNHPVNGYTAR